MLFVCALFLLVKIISHTHTHIHSHMFAVIMVVCWSMVFCGRIREFFYKTEASNLFYGVSAGLLIMQGFFKSVVFFLVSLKITIQTFFFELFIFHDTICYSESDGQGTSDSVLV